MRKNTIEKMRSDLWLQSALREARDNKERESRKKIAAGIRDVPIGKMYDQVKYLLDTYLPWVKEKRGENSSSYKMFSDITDSLVWAITVCDRYDVSQMQNTRLKLLSEFYREQAEMFQTELFKYTTMEEILLTDGLNRYREAILTRVQSLIKK